MEATTSGLHLLTSPHVARWRDDHLEPQRCLPAWRLPNTGQPRGAGEGLGPSNLSCLVRGQRAGPTVRKVPESNKVLTLRASSAVPVRGEIPLSVARFSCALSVRIWVSQGRTGEGKKLGASHPVFWIPLWQVFACLELTNWFLKRRNHDRSNGAKNTAMAQSHL